MIFVIITHLLIGLDANKVEKSNPILYNSLENLIVVHTMLFSFFYAPHSGRTRVRQEETPQKKVVENSFYPEELELETLESFETA